MLHKTLAAVTAVLTLTSLGFAAENSEEVDITIDMNEEIEIGNYVIEYYRAAHSDNEERLKIGYDTGTTLKVLKIVDQEELYESEGENLNISEELDLKIDLLGSSREGIYLDLVATAEHDLISSAEMDIDAPSSINVGQGEETTLPIQISNTGLTNQTFELEASESDTVETVFRNDGFTVSEVFVEAGETETVDAEIDLSQQAEPETHIMEFKAENTSSLAETVNIEVDGAERHESMSLI